MISGHKRQADLVLLWPSRVCNQAGSLCLHYTGHELYAAYPHARHSAVHPAQNAAFNASNLPPSLAVARVVDSVSEDKWVYACSALYSALHDTAVFFLAHHLFPIQVASEGIENNLAHLLLLVRRHRL